MADYYNQDEDDDVMECPLCTDPLDLTERCFKPCPCGYQVRPSSSFSLDFTARPLFAHHLANDMHQHSLIDRRLEENWR